MIDLTTNNKVFRYFVKTSIITVLVLNSISLICTIFANTNLFNTYNSLCNRIQVNREIGLDTYNIIKRVRR